MNDEARDIHVKGARVHNLRNLELRIPRGKLVVITGVSGSGKSSLAFDTIYAEGYRKYMESLSTQARQALEQLTRPDVDFIHGLSPVLAIGQRTPGGNPRSTIATVTEIADYARLLWVLEGEMHCPKDGGRVVQQTLDSAVERLLAEPEATRCVLLSPWMHAKPSVLRDEIDGLRQRGFQRVRIEGKIRNIDEPKLIPSGAAPIQVDIVIDRLVLARDQRSRIADSLELAFREGSDRAIAMFERGPEAWDVIHLSQNLSCSVCGDVFEPLSPRQFSFNTTEGACPTCGGLGRQRQFDESLIVPDTSKSVRGGALKPLRIGGRNVIIRYSSLLKQLAEQLPYDPNCPWAELPGEVREAILNGAGERVFSFRLKRGRKALPEAMCFDGVIAILDKARTETRSDGYRARLSTFQRSGDCPTCHGRRLTPRSTSVLIKGTSIADFFAMDIGAAGRFLQKCRTSGDEAPALEEVLDGISRRIHFLEQVGLDYLGLDREYSTLSGGESQRVRLATQLGMGLIGVIYVLDEPSIGLHPHDNANLLRTLQALRDGGNTVIVVEHDEETMLAADHLIELGPGAGASGGAILFQGAPEACAALPADKSRTGPYLSGERTVQRDARSLRPDGRWVTVHGAAQNNLCGIDVRFPVGRLTCVSGVSGSGKSTLVNDILAAAAARKLNRAKTIPGVHKGIDGLEHFEKTVVVDQEPIGRSPRSNPATYVKLFDQLRGLFAKCPLAKVRGYKPSRFSFNVRGGRCERCQGDGVIKLDMMFMSDAYTECPSCHGMRYNRETLEVRFAGRTIADVLAMTVSEARDLFRNIPKVAEKLATLEEVGLGYLQLGQPANTLSGGEAQRIKLSLELSKREQGRTLYILDEPTTGLHWVDVQNLMDLLFRLRDAGNTIVVIEHHLDVVGLADWIVDLGPGGGTSGGDLVVAGTVGEVVACSASLTGQALKSKRSVPA